MTLGEYVQKRRDELAQQLVELGRFNELGHDQIVAGKWAREQDEDDWARLYAGWTTF